MHVPHRTHEFGKWGAFMDLTGNETGQDTARENDSARPGMNEDQPAYNLR